MKKKRINVIFKIIIFLIIFLGAVLLFFFLSRKNSKSVEDTVFTKKNAVLPVIETKVGNHYVNEMHGYVNDMVDRYMRDTITPLPENRELALHIREDGAEVKSVRYEIRSLDTTQLVENTNIESFSRKDSSDGKSYIDIKLPIQNLLDENEEYNLIVYLETDKYKEVAYYTRIVYSDLLDTEKMINFISDFHDNTLNPSSKAGLSAYLKNTTDTSGSLGKVTLNSTYKQLLWNYVNPKQIGSSSVSIMDINNTIGTFIINSRVKFKDENEKNHICDVKEIFTVQLSNGYWYILNYDRTANEELNTSSIDIKNERIRLGIVEDDSVHVIKNKDDSIQFFSYGGDVWINDSKEEKSSLKKLFGFANENDDSRDCYDKHNIKLVSVSDNGDVSFILYGYMNNGNHEGEVGIVFYKYKAADNCLKEIFYLPFDRSYEILEQEIGQLAYLNKSGLFYIMFNGKIYAIDFAGQEYMTVVENVSYDSIVINSDSSIVAYEKNRKAAGSKLVEIFYLEDGHQNKIKANNNEYLSAVGFIGNDFVLGKIKDSDYKKYNKEISKPIYKLEVIDENGEKAAEYKKDNILITGSNIENGSIKFSRVQTNGGVIRKTSDDVLVENVDNISAEKELLTSEKTSSEYKEWYLSAKVSEQGKSIPEVSTISVTDSSYLDISLSAIAEDGMYFAYSKGKLQKICSTASEAVKIVYDDIGYVIDSSGNYVLRRGYRKYNLLDISISDKAYSKEERARICMKAFSDFEEGSYSDTFDEMKKEKLSDAQMIQRGMDTIVYNLTGCSLEQVVHYYIGHNHPIYSVTKDGAVLIVGAGNENVYILNPSTDKIDTVSIGAASKMFSDAGNIFISCMSH